MKSGDVLEKMKANYGAAWTDLDGRDTWKVGGPDIDVKGVATTFMTTLDLLQRAVAAGCNMIVTHETTYWNDRDVTTDLLNDPIYKHKLDYCTKNNIAVVRFHDHAHGHRPDFIWQGLVRLLGFEKFAATPTARTFTLPETTLGQLATDLQRRTGSRAFRVAGDPKAKVSTVGLAMGYGVPRFTPQVDVVIGGENPETGGALDPAEYAMDAAFFGKAKGLIVLGHNITEEPGMEDVANWLKGFITDVPVKFIRSGEPYWSPRPA